MVRRSPWAVAVLLLGLWLVPILPVRADLIPDPAGDTFNTATFDILGTEVLPGATITRVTLQIAGNVTGASAFAANSLFGYIDLDTNPGPDGTAPWGGALAGGNNAWINYFIPPNPGIPTIPGPLVTISDEYYINLGLEAGGFVDLISAATNAPVGAPAPIFFTYNAITNVTTVRIDLPTSAITVGSASGLKYAVIVGDVFGAVTDRAPNGPNALAAVPEPSSMLLAGVAGLGALAFRWRRQRKVAA